MSVVGERPAPAAERVRRRLPAPPRSLADRVGLLATLVPLVIVAVQGWALRWVADDAFINFRVVDQLIHGNGPVFNVGERVEVYTSTVWLGILWLGTQFLGVQVEWLSVVLGIGLSVAGLAAACVAAAGLARDRTREGVLLPLGALVFAVLPATWEFITSGLETGLSFAWIGGSFLVLVRAYLRAESGRPASEPRLGLAAAMLGFGPLVRPDFAVFSLAFMAVLLVIAGRPMRRRGLRLVAAAAAAPLAYELFRMGYFAATVPNTAIAKEAGATYLSQGWRYLWDTVGAYLLWLPLVALTAWGVSQWREDRRSGHGRRALVAASPAVAGLVHALFVVKVGGDFMHGRMLLPAIFAIASPVAVVAVTRRRAALVLAAGVSVWALVCGLGLRVPYDDGRLVSGQRIVDERAYYVGQAKGPANPITRQDYANFSWEQQGTDARIRAARGERTVTFNGPNQDLPSVPADTPARSDLPVHMVAVANNIGLFGFAAGPDVWVVDRLGLGDPIAARIKLFVRDRPGHEKLMPPQWAIARFSDPAQTASDAWVNSARHAMNCSVWWWDGTGVHKEDRLPRLLAAVSDPISPGRFLSNVKFSLSGANFRFPGHPPAAEADLCGPFR